MQPIKYVVGQKLWCNNRFSTKGDWIEVTKVGRKWVELAHGAYKVAKNSREAEGFSVVLYSSEEEYLQSCAVQKDWESFRDAVARHYRVPDEVTPEAITAARSALKL